MPQDLLISPYCGPLVDLIVADDERRGLFERANRMPSIRLSRRETYDLEMLATGAFSPLATFMASADLERVVDEMRLADGTLFPIPIFLTIEDPDVLGGRDSVALRDEKNDVLAVLDVSEVFEWRRDGFAERVFGTSDARHPLVSELAGLTRYAVSGRLRVLALPAYHDFNDLRMTPAQVRHRLNELGRADVVAFQTRNPIHFAHERMTQIAMERADATLLLHPVVGMTKEGDIDHYTRVRSYKAVAELAYPPDRVLLSLLPLAMRMAGPREAIWHAIIRRNYGANHLIVGRDHASPGIDSHGRPFYRPAEAQEAARQYEGETGVKTIAFGEFVYLPDEDRYAEASDVAAGTRVFALSGSRVRDDFLATGKPLPAWFTRPQVARILSDAHPRRRQGVCIWFTGLSGSGKTTTAEILVSRLLEYGRRVTLLDGDVIRTNLSKGLGFSKEDRNTNIARIAFVASEIVRHGGIAICAAVSPYAAARADARLRFAEGAFIEVFVDTPLEVCEIRDPKGMYAMARRGEIRDLTGVDQAYERPEAAEIVLDTTRHSAIDNVGRIIQMLLERGFLTGTGGPEKTD